ncbi:GNAT family N-acetyltransferase [Streptomyces sp. NPDC005551]|uniref:GNAT family N-acetyltransferase n=1 Tax=Streptomyces sp. NPDC005551 TaxID=3364725 RepID=UPI00367DCA86
MGGIVRAWVDGWVASRGAAPPVAEQWGFTVDVGLADHVTRHVFAATGDDVEEAAVRKVADGVTGSGVWLKVFAEASVVGPWLGAGWWVDPDPGFLMTVALADTGAEAAAGARPLPDGYRLRTWARGGVGHALVAAADGSWAAHGHVAPTGATAVFDRIATAPGHRRQGLGRLIMRSLTELAVAQGAVTGVLAGTPDGRALYESLKWQVAAPLTSARFTAR